jgi:PAS domain-containing protein
LSAEEKSKQARARIESDLQRWQDKFAKAADKGIEDLEERIGDIVSALIANSANSHGESLSTALRAVSAEKISSIKQRINELAAALPEEDAPEEEEESRDKLLVDIRSAAVLVRDRAHALRQWSLSFDEELLRRVSAAINSTLDVLDSIRDLGLQEIGTRWAWMDDVTYKDWAKYHALKVQIDDWRNEIRKVGMNHKSIAEAQSAAAGILDSGMEVAEDTARELIRLKDVGNWKIAAREVGDNFDTRTEPPPPRPKPVVESEESEGTDNDEVFEEATMNSEAFSSTSQEDDTEETPTSATSGDLPEEADEAMESETTLDNEDAEERVLDAIFEEDKYATKPAFGVAAATLNSQQEPILDEDEQDAFHNLAHKVGDVYCDASSAFADSTAQAKILYEIAKSQVMGQMAHSSAPAHAQVLSSIESAYSGAVKYATEEFEARIAAVKATPTTAGPLAHISSVASSRLSEGLSLASEQLALHTVPATSSVGFQPFVLDAQRRYYEAVGVAHEHYTAFVSTASEAVYGTPTPTPAPLDFRNLVEQAGSQYEQASSLASASLAAVVASASSMVSAADDGRSQSIIDDASSRYQAALSAASSSLSLASASASSAIYGTTPGALESLSSQASENWEMLVAKASEQIYGTPAPYLQQVVDNHVPHLEAVQAIVSELLIGKQPSFTESVLSKLRVAYETPYPAAAVSAASSYASEAYEAVSSATNAFVSDIPSVEDIMQQANDQLQAAVEAASVGIYGTPKGRFEQATEAAAEAYSSASAQISGAVYGKEPSYIDIARDNIEQIQSKASAAIYGEEPGAVESATSRLAAAVESAQAQLADLASSASSFASEAVETAVPHADQITSSIKAGASSLTKDEL